MPPWIIAILFVLQIPIIMADCVPANCPYACCDRFNNCAYTPDQCVTTSKSSNNQNTLILVLIAIAVLLCLALMIFSYLKRRRLQRLQASRRAAVQAQAQQRHHQQQRQQGQQSNSLAENIMNLLPMIPQMPAEQIDNSVHKGEPFREGAMQKAYEINVLKIEYGSIGEPALADEKKQLIVERSAVPLSNRNNQSRHAGIDNENNDDDEKLSIGNILRSNGDDSD